MSTILKGGLVVVGLLMGLITACLGQSKNTDESLTINLSNPGKPGTLRVSLIHGSINVSGYNGKEVVVSHSQKQGNRGNNPEESEGLRRLPNTHAGFEAREENNHVTIKTSSVTRAVDLSIKVPTNFSLKLSTINEGEITVEEVSGELDIDNINGSITLRNVAGSASASTLNGNILATFRKVTPNMPMAFSNLNGKIDVALPATAKFNAKLKTDNGEIYTDFDMSTDKNTNVGQKSNLNSDQRIYLDKWKYGIVNGGGPEMLFKNFNGNIYIRKSK